MFWVGLAVKSIHDFKEGSRVSFVDFIIEEKNSISLLNRGAKGTVLEVDALGQILVEWDGVGDMVMYPEEIKVYDVI